MNIVVLKGNLTRDPEIKVLNINGKSVTVCNFTVAVSRKFKKANGDVEQDTTFVSCEAWDSGAETLGKYVAKGDPIALEGTLKTESWEDKEGKKISRLKVRVNNFDLLYRAPAKDNGATEEGTDQF